MCVAFLFDFTFLFHYVSGATWDPIVKFIRYNVAQNPSPHSTEKITMCVFSFSREKGVIERFPENGVI